jgi:acetylornithine deacetylase
MEDLKKDARNFLIELIETPSFSREEENTALIIEKYLKQKNISYQRKMNNIWAKNFHFDESLPTILLNSHHDTVKPNSAYTINPFVALEEDGKIFGLGSNDAGASLVSLWAVFSFFYDKKLKYNLIYAATAEEEISGEKGVGSILTDLDKINFAIVGEPTKMDLAIAEKGLVVLNCVAKGTVSHAAHQNDDNSIYKALRDIQKVQQLKFDKESEVLGNVKATVTIINAGSQHNVVPDQCLFMVDIRTNEHYTNSEIVEIFRNELESEIEPRSLSLNSSRIDLDHPFVEAAKMENCRLYGSPTVSDQALMPFDSVKIGPGDSVRSHTADEFIYQKELDEGIEKYIKILSHLL